MNDTSACTTWPARCRKAYSQSVSGHSTPESAFTAMKTIVAAWATRKTALRTHRQPRNAPTTIAAWPPRTKQTISRCANTSRSARRA
jgi:hypothetical protein